MDQSVTFRKQVHTFYTDHLLNTKLLKPFGANPVYHATHKMPAMKNYTNARPEKFLEESQVHMVNYCMARQKLAI